MESPRTTNSKSDSIYLIQLLYTSPSGFGQIKPVFSTYFKYDINRKRVLCGFECDNLTQSFLWQQRSVLHQKADVGFLRAHLVVSDVPVPLYSNRNIYLEPYFGCVKL